MVVRTKQGAALYKYLVINVLQVFMSISFWPSQTISNPRIMFVDQFLQNVDLHFSQNNLRVIKTEYKEIEKHWHIFILISFKCIRIMIFDCTGY